jgi:sugar (pentulose or hexulose) kinase
VTHALVGIDVGTSSVKATAIDVTGRERGRAGRPTPWRPSASGEDLDPQAVLATARDCAEEAARAAGLRVAAVGVAGLAESGVLLGADGVPLAPISAWHDRSGAEAEADLRATFGDAGFARRTGQPILRRLSAVKLRHLASHRGGVPPGARWLSVPEWIVHALGGAAATERSLGCRTGFVDIGTGDWCEDVLGWAGLSAEGLAAPIAAGTDLGAVACGELRGARLTVGGHDHLCAAVGAGATGAGDVFDSWGNGEGVLRPLAEEPDTDAVVRDGTSISWHALPGRAVVRGLGSGLLLRRVLEALGGPDRAVLDERARTAEPLDLPLDDDGAPDLTELDADPARIWRSALELTFGRVRASIALYETLCGPTDRVLGAGGWLRSPALAALKHAAIPGFERTPIDEPGAHGAALLAGVAAELLPAQPTPR